MRKLFLTGLLFLMAMGGVQAEDWGQTGHRATAAIAVNYLTPKARKAVQKLLGAGNLVTVSTYADEIKSYEEYWKYSSWHYVNIEPGMTYTEAPKNKSGDLVMAIKDCKKVLADPDAAPADKLFYLKLLVHFMGDLHQPLHLGHAADKGGNDFQVNWFNEGTNLHKVWDTKMIESYGMSYSELATNFGKVSKNEFKLLTSGSLEDWVVEGQGLAEEVYNSAEIGERLGYRYRADYMKLVTQRLQIGGLRLAAVLNDLFG